MKGIVVLAILIGSVASSHAEVFKYTCKVDGKSLHLGVDDGRSVLVWRGKTYRIRVQENCAKYGWHAEGNGTAFDFCTATQGYADFEENGAQIQCGQDR